MSNEPAPGSESGCIAGVVIMVWYGMVWYGMVWYGMVWYGMVWYGMRAAGLVVGHELTLVGPHVAREKGVNLGRQP
jgi:hypothetical protein